MRYSGFEVSKTSSLALITLFAPFSALCTQRVITIKKSTVLVKWRLTGRKGEQTKPNFQFPWNFLNGNACFTPNAAETHNTTHNPNTKIGFTLFSIYLNEYSIPCFPLSLQLNYISVLNIGHKNESEKKANRCSLFE